MNSISSSSPPRIAMRTAGTKAFVNLIVKNKINVFVVVKTRHEWYFIAKKTKMADFLSNMALSDII